MLISISQIYQQSEKISKLATIKVGGWVKSIRKGKEIAFITINDGSTLNWLQIVISLKNFPQVNFLNKINFGGCLSIIGQLVLTPKSAQPFELQAIKIEFSNRTDDDYPLQKKTLTLETIRNYPHLRAKTNYFLTMLRLRHSLSLAIHQFFQQEGFYYLHTPIITSNDTEDSGEMFNVVNRFDNNYQTNFFGKPAQLTVSGQLQAEALVQGLGKVYTFNPCFRAENSHTTRHLAEFWMLEPEMAFADLNDIIILAEKLVKFVINYALNNNYLELEYFVKKGELKIEKLQEIIKQPFAKITYTEAIQILQAKKFKETSWGIDLQSEEEKYLCRYFNKPVFITDYPTKLKAFYMKSNSDDKTVAAMDLLLPEIGELIGGSAREDNYENLQKKIKKIDLTGNNLKWYLDLRRFGYAPSAGFGLGFERLLMFISGIKNIRDTIAFPIYASHLNF